MAVAASYSATEFRRLKGQGDLFGVIGRCYGCPEPYARRLRAILVVDIEHVTDETSKRDEEPYDEPPPELSLVVKRMSSLGGGFELRDCASIPGQEQSKQPIRRFRCASS